MQWQQVEDFIARYDVDDHAARTLRDADFTVRAQILKSTCFHKARNPSAKLIAAIRSINGASNPGLSDDHNGWDGWRNEQHDEDWQCVKHEQYGEHDKDWHWSPSGKHSGTVYTTVDIPGGGSCNNDYEHRGSGDKHKHRGEEGGWAGADESTSKKGTHWSHSSDSSHGEARDWGYGNHWTNSSQEGARDWYDHKHWTNSGYEAARESWHEMWCIDSNQESKRDWWYEKHWTDASHNEACNSWQEEHWTEMSRDWWSEQSTDTSNEEARDCWHEKHWSEAAPELTVANDLSTWQSMDPQLADALSAAGLEHFASKLMASGVFACSDVDLIGEEGLLKNPPIGPGLNLVQCRRFQKAIADHNITKLGNAIEKNKEDLLLQGTTSDSLVDQGKRGVKRLAEATTDDRAMAKQLRLATTKPSNQTKCSIELNGAEVKEEIHQSHSSADLSARSPKVLPCAGLGDGGDARTAAVTVTFSENAQVFTVNRRQPGERVRIKVSVSAAGGDKEHAQTVANLCKQKLLHGVSPKGVRQFRDASLKEHSKSKPKQQTVPKASAAKPSINAVTKRGCKFLWHTAFKLQSKVASRARRKSAGSASLTLRRRSKRYSRITSSAVEKLHLDLASMDRKALAEAFVSAARNPHWTAMAPSWAHEALTLEELPPQPKHWPQTAWPDDGSHCSWLPRDWDLGSKLTDGGGLLRCYVPRPGVAGRLRFHKKDVERDVGRILTEDERGPKCREVMISPEFERTHGPADTTMILRKHGTPLKSGYINQRCEDIEGLSIKEALTKFDYVHVAKGQTFKKQYGLRDLEYDLKTNRLILHKLNAGNTARPGAKVLLNGLEKSHSLNGCEARLVSYDKSTARWLAKVLCDKFIRINVKPGNFIVSGTCEHSQK